MVFHASSSRALLTWKLKTSARAISFVSHLSEDVTNVNKNISPILIVNKHRELQLLTLKTINLAPEKVSNQRI
jgi:hypothetical protein